MVTGGAGFVGSHLIDSLIAKNHEVVCLDNFSTGKKVNIKSFEDSVEIINGDIRDPETVQLALNGVDSVYHLAAQISVSRSVREPQYDASINIEGMLTLLESIRKKDTKRIIFVSTGGAIYGEPSYVPASEKTDEKPISPYGISKLASEVYLRWYHDTHGISYSIIRPSNIYGPRQDPLGEAGVISIFLGQIYANKPVTIFGDGEDTRDYIYVKDLAEVCMKAMNSSKCDTYNAGTGKQTNLLELVGIIEKVTGKKAEKNFAPVRPGDVKHIALDSRKAQKDFSWSPETDLITGINKTWNWFISSLSS